MEEYKVFQRCRTCLTTINTEMYHIQEKLPSGDENVRNMLELLQLCASIQISVNDGYPQYVCNVCFQKANDFHQFRIQCANVAMQLKTELESQKQFLDNSCNKIKTAEVEKNESISTIKTWSCNQCDKQFKYQTSLIKHRSKHKARKSICVFCNESLETAALLARHMEHMHAHLKPLKCSVCNKAFFKEANLRLHMNVHSGVKRHMCEVCGMAFALAGNLTAHRRLHTGQKPYKCKDCGRGFTQQAALRSHEAGHSDKKEHVCSECGAAFSRAGALRNHSKRHLSVRPFVCNLCNKAFTFSSERKRHMTIHTGEKNHECNICGSRFNRSTNLAVHRRIHTGETPHVCSVCGKRYNQAHCLTSHMSIHSCAN